jgi:hypothetical protein
MPIKQRMPLTPELREKLKVHQATITETWFGFKLAQIGISRRFFPWHLCFRIKDAKPS